MKCLCRMGGIWQLVTRMSQLSSIAGRSPSWSIKVDQAWEFGQDLACTIVSATPGPDPPSLPPSLLPSTPFNHLLTFTQLFAWDYLLWQVASTPPPVMGRLQLSHWHSSSIYYWSMCYGWFSATSASGIHIPQVQRNHRIGQLMTWFDDESWKPLELPGNYLETTTQVDDLAVS